MQRSYAGGLELRGKTLGIVGLGRIGARVARIASAFGMDVLACAGWARSRADDGAEGNCGSARFAVKW